jgi:hypothetical protein
MKYTIIQLFGFRIRSEAASSNTYKDDFTTESRKEKQKGLAKEFNEFTDSRFD